jgi:protein-S-isoprenylcysteine O-methyltransferase Ste14
MKGHEIMLDTRIILSGSWITVILLYLVGDVLRLYSGDFARMEAASPSSSEKWLIAAIFLLIPVLMTFLSLVLPQSVARWANIILAVGFFLFVLADLGSYPSLYDKFLLVVSLIFNGVTLWYAWNWNAP